jgi:hypothetical protein
MPNFRLDEAASCLPYLSGPPPLILHLVQNPLGTAQYCEAISVPCLLGYYAVKIRTLQLEICPELRQSATLAQMSENSDFIDVNQCRVTSLVSLRGKNAIDTGQGPELTGKSSTV